MFAGQTDSPLTARGREQAKVVAAALRPVPFDRIVASTLSRTKDTAERIAAGRHIPVETFAELKEIDLGDAAGKPFDEMRGLPNYDGDGFTQWPGGESLDELAQVKGVGPTFLKRHGPNVLALVSGRTAQAAEQSPATAGSNVKTSAR